MQTCIHTRVHPGVANPCANMRVDMCADMGADIGADTCADMCVDTCVRICTEHVNTHAAWSLALFSCRRRRCFLKEVPIHVCSFCIHSHAHAHVYTQHELHRHRRGWLRCVSARVQTCAATRACRCIQACPHKRPYACP